SPGRVASPQAGSRRRSRAGPACRLGIRRYAFGRSLRVAIHRFVVADWRGTGGRPDRVDRLSGRRQACDTRGSRVRVAMTTMTTTLQPFDVVMHLWTTM